MFLSHKETGTDSQREPVSVSFTSACILIGNHFHFCFQLIIMDINTYLPYFLITKDILFPVILSYLQTIFEQL